MKKLPISIQTFESVIEGQMIYVDKTEIIWNLIQKGRYYFLARPRRFGKSMLLSTIKAYFQGKKHLFEGLYIYEKEQTWEKHPVIHLDYSRIEYHDSKERFELSLITHINFIANSYKINLESTLYADAFTELILKLYEKHGKVVVLIDEYDKALVDLLTDEKRFYENRTVLSNLYGTMKSLDEYLRFVFLTGVSRFSKVNIFSGMNNLEDISENLAYSTIVGFSQKELEDYFGDWIEKMNNTTFQMPLEELKGHIKFWYNGFSFDGTNKLYNPFSLLNLFSNLDFGNYWFSSGTPTFLMELIKHQKQIPETFENIKVSDLTGSTQQIKNLPLIPLLYQTGYLTIAKMVREGVRKYFHLDYPNEEVRHSFLTFLLAAFVEKDEFEIQPEAIELRHALRDERTDYFVERLQSFFADIPSELHIPREAYYHSLVYMILRIVGVKLLLEKNTSKGRIDAVYEDAERIYIIEFKFATDKRTKRAETLANKALKQITEKKYYEPYLSLNKKVILFGIGFLEKDICGKVKVWG